MNRELLILFESNFGEPVTEVLPMAVHASKRSLYRLKSLHHAAIAVEYQNVPENRAFIGFSRHFRALGLNVPEIYAVSSDATGYIQQDLGDITLFDCVKEARDRGSRFTPELERLYGEAVRHAL
jgi:aminoglycoside/choline kinase family phosphotransferase